MRRIASRPLARGVRQVQSRLSSHFAVRSSLALAVPCGRCFFEPRRGVAHAGVNTTARTELQEEQSRDDKQAPELPAGWSASPTPGTNVFTLKKTFEDESLEVFSGIPTQDEKGKRNDAMSFELIVSKGGKALVFGLGTDGEGELLIDSISFSGDAAFARNRSPEALSKKATLYPGPAISELNNDLVENFVQYLEERGVNDAFAEFMEKYAFWVEQQEYEEWLSQVIAFTA